MAEKENKYQTLCINMTELSVLPESDSIVRLLWGLNDMNQIVYLAKLVQKAENESPHLWKFHEGINSTLMRQRSSRASEILETIVRPLIADDADVKHPILHQLILADNKLTKYRLKLRKLFYGQYKSEFEIHRQIRHRITEHFDHKESFATLPRAISQSIDEWKQISDEPMEGWIVRGISSSNKEQSRFLLVDSALNVAWRNILSVPFSKTDYKTCPITRRARRFTVFFMKLFHTFAFRLSEAYFLKYQLFLSHNAEDLLQPTHLKNET